MGLFGANPDLSRLEERLEKLERSHRALETEWTTWYEKAQKLLWRVIKRAEAIEGREDPSPPVENRSEGNVERKVDPISAKILARRNRAVLPG